MILSAASQHAIRTLVHLAQVPAGESVLGRDLAVRAGIPANFLAKIMLTLRNAGLVDATRGQGSDIGWRRGRRKSVIAAIPGMTRERADGLLQLIASESALEESQFKGLVVSTEPFTEQDIALGRQYVMGTTRLSNGVASCFSCHSVQGTRALGGWRLGPDLSRVYQRLGGEAPWKNLTAGISPRGALRKCAKKSAEREPLGARISHYSLLRCAQGQPCHRTGMPLTERDSRNQS
ncbi:MAG: RrF2 family transcriptional regulator [Pirellulaceae bacterium]